MCLEIAMLHARRIIFILSFVMLIFGAISVVSGFHVEHTRVLAATGVLGLLANVLFWLFRGGGPSSCQSGQDSRWRSTTALIHLAASKPPTDH